MLPGVNLNFIFLQLVFSKQNSQNINHFLIIFYRIQEFKNVCSRYHNRNFQIFIFKIKDQYLLGLKDLEAFPSHLLHAESPPEPVLGKVALPPPSC